MSQYSFTPSGIPILILWTIALIAYIPTVRARLRFPLGAIALVVGWLVLTADLVWQWRLLGHPPMRTISQTMEWAAFFLPVVSLGIETVWKSRTQILPSIIIAMLFIIGTVARHEPLEKELMPALQSPWFAPHVLIYMLAYATLGVSCVISAYYLIAELFTKQVTGESVLEDVRRLVRIAFPLLTAGMLLGAFWAKIAWGHYWGWDPKETAAFISWAAYLGYLHLDYRVKLAPRWQLSASFIAGLLIAFCWFMINILPADSIHKYAK